MKALLCVFLALLTGCAGVLGPKEAAPNVVIVPSRVPARIWFTSEPVPGFPDSPAAVTDGKLGVDATTAGAATGIVGGVIRSTPLVWLGGILGLGGVAGKSLNRGSIATGDGIVAALAQAVGPASQGRKVSLTIEYEKE